MQIPNYYDILEISPDASAEVIRAAYRSLSKKYHPDSNPDSDETKHFKRIQEAYEVLSDPEKRRHYDEQLGRTGRASGNRERKGQGSAESATGQLPPDLTVMKVDGTSSFLTLSEHFKRKWKETAGCDLSDMKFDGVSFRGAVLNGAKLDGSSFVGCDFRDADLTDCSARDCDFHGVTFEGSDIQDLDLSTCNLVNTNLHRVKYNSGTQFPDGYPIPDDALNTYKNRKREQAEMRAMQRGGCIWVFLVILVILPCIFVFSRS